MPSRPPAAHVFHELHKDFLILPNAWDAVSAKLIERAGAKAIATSSAAVAWSHGYPDGDRLPIAKAATAVEEIARVVSVPITVDAEGGYSDDPSKAAENIAALIGAGAVGINLEDGKSPHELHLRKIEAIRAAAERAGVNLFINARTDVYLKQLAPAEARVEESIKRGRACREAGASGLFVPGLLAQDEILAIARGVPMPLNIMSRKGVASAEQLRSWGARRLSAAGGIFHAAA